MKVLFWVLALFVFFLNSPLYALPKGRALEITARKFELLNNGKKLLAEGDVIVERPELLLYAERVVYEPQTELLYLENFRLFDFTQNATLLGERAYFDLRNGEISSPKIFIYLKKEGFRIKAWDFNKNALNEYTAKRALITTCELDCEKEGEFPPWSVEVGDIVLTPEGTTSSKATLFRAKSLPLLYLPKKVYLPSASLPIFEPRKSGFLPPNISQGNRLGFGFQLPFFYPLTDQIDFTISPLYTTKRGLLWDLENQWALSNETKGIFKVRYLRDTKRGEYVTTTAPKERYWVTGKMDLVPNQNLDLHLDLDFISDKDFLEEFNVGEGGFDRVKNLYLERFSRDVEDKSQDYRTSMFWGQYRKESFYALFTSKYPDYEGLLNKKEILKPLAGLYLSLLPFEFKGVLPSLNLTYDYLYRERGYRGNRLGLNLEISYPFAFSFLKSEFKVNSQNYYYFLSEKGNFTKDNLSVNLFSATLTTYTQLSRNYALNLPFRAFNFQHILKPYLTFFYRKDLKAEEVPLFVYEDYFTNKTKTLEYGLWQFFTSQEAKNFFVVRAYQQYDFNKAERSATAKRPEERAFSDLYLQLFTNWKGRLSARYDTTYNFYGLGFKKHSLNLSLRKVYLELVDFTYEEDKAWNTRQATLRLGELFFNQKLALNYYISRNLKTNETSEQRLEALYLTECYLLGIGMTVTPRDTKFYFRVDLRGLGGLGEKTLYQP